jgi:beta-xylosidase
LIMRAGFTFFLVLFVSAQLTAQSKVWVADNGNGTYKNPILHADYSDPDVIRVGDNYYMTASSFEDVPGLPILHSKDLVNWKLIGHALVKLQPHDHFSIPRHGEGIWAPAIRFRNGEFLIYYPDPDFGIYLIKAKDPAGPWSEPILVEAGKGLIDPCPLWDNDGKAYLVHAFAGSRAGIKSILVVKKMNAAGTKTLDNGVMVFDGHITDQTVEGPKFYKRNGWYYIFAPAGGVSTGWQLVLRSKNIYGPYERKVVMDQGRTNINGPHQGAWIETEKGEDWFIHFQDKGAYGRIVHLQPMRWMNDWPVIGADKYGDGKGEPVLEYKKPLMAKTYPVQTPPDSDEFDKPVLGLQWQWMSNPKQTWAFVNPSKSVLTIFSDVLPAGAKNLWDAGNVLQQKFPAESFTLTTKMEFFPNQKLRSEKAGLVVMGLEYEGLALRSVKDSIQLVYMNGKDAAKGKAETETVVLSSVGKNIYLRVDVSPGAVCRFSYSLDGKFFTVVGSGFVAQPGRWKGAKLGLFASREEVTNDAGYAEFDWFRLEPYSRR